MRRQKRLLLRTVVLNAIVSCAICDGAWPARAQQSGGAQQTGGPNAADQMFKEPYIDVDEWRDKPVRHRYVHGGFKGTEARFSFYFPPKEQNQGRFFQQTLPFQVAKSLSSRA